MSSSLPAERSLQPAPTCFRLEGDELLPALNRSGDVDPRAELVHEQFRALVSSRRFSCLGAKSALASGQYWLGVYDELGSQSASGCLGRDLEAFSVRESERDSADRTFRTFVATFSGPVCEDEKAFEDLLWQQLQMLHDIDRRTYEWDPAVDSDPDEPHFSFSFGGRAYFVVGLHAASSRWARRFAWPTLVFNPHQQFEQLREQGLFTRFRDQIRVRDRTLQRSLNPMLSTYGEHSEARQYSGRKVEHDWRCPFERNSSERGSDD